VVKRKTIKVLQGLHKDFYPQPPKGGLKRVEKKSSLGDLGVKKRITIFAILKLELVLQFCYLKQPCAGKNLNT
jgi:hypothetical protein